MGNFECTTVEDLLFNRSFRTWVLNRNSPESGFWENWVGQNADKAELINQAKSIVYALQFHFKALDEESIQGEIKKVLQKLKNRSPEEKDSPEGIDLPFERKKKHSFHWLIGASLSLAIAATFIIITISLFHLHAGRKTAPQYEFLSAETKSHSMEQVNHSDTAQLITLPDGSTVRLERNSKLTYAPGFSGQHTREVYLDGEGFFEIKRNATKPFLVLTHRIITKVLGTSFTVKAYASDKKAMVSVKTGKVSVFKTNSFHEPLAIENEGGGILVTPNQEIVYNEDNNELLKTLAEEPALIITPVKTTFTFNATPVSQVFKILQDAYGIPIMYDEEAISSCSISRAVEEGSFYEKLTIICKAIDASYEMVDGNIIINSNGCK